MLAEKFLNKGLIPDSLIRFKIRNLLEERLRQEKNASQESFVREIQGAPIAVETKSANDQHYEIPAAFFEKVLGPRLKYSCAFFESKKDTLAQAEERMLRLTCERAEIQDGQTILELGCGWGSLTLWIAETFPHSKIVGVSNSKCQREFILSRAAQRGVKNVTVLTCDMNEFHTDLLFDRVVSVEMFEHMRNIPKLLSKIAVWLKPKGKLFVHIFSHRRYSYFFEDKNERDWMARHFFTGGMMPSHGLYRHFNQDLSIEKEWVIPGHHYMRTAEAWLKNLDASQREIRQIFRVTYGTGSETTWIARWRVFFMSCAELWGFKGGEEWQVSHYLFRRSRSS